MTFRITLLLTALCILSGCAAAAASPAPDQAPPAAVPDQLPTHFFLTRGGYLPDVSHTVFLLGGSYYLSSHTGAAQRISTEDVRRLQELITRYDLASWDGFAGHNRHVLDGESFRLEIEYPDGTAVQASGSNAFPQGYRDAAPGIEAYLVSLHKELPVAGVYRSQAADTCYTVTLRADGSFACVDGTGNTIRKGSWSANGIRLSIDESEDGAYGFSAMIPLEDALVYVAEDSYRSVFTGLPDGASFSRTEATVETEETCMIRGSMGTIYGELKVPASDGPVPLVILSHGFGGDHRGNTDYAARFFSKGFAVYNFDFCGGGPGSHSDGTMLKMTVLTEAEDLNAIVDRFGDDPRFSSISLWGASQGGFVSAYVAASRPKDIAKLVLEFPAIVLQDDAKARADADGSFPETSGVLGLTISRKYNEDATSFDLYDMLPKYTGPVLILHGDRDPIVPLSYSQRAADAFPNAELVVLPGQGHGFMGSAYTEAMDREAEFLGR